MLIISKRVLNIILGYCLIKNEMDIEEMTLEEWIKYCEDKIPITVNENVFEYTIN